jgi:hypothetical protein
MSVPSDLHLREIEYHVQLLQNLLFCMGVRLDVSQYETNTG